jgi:hypothetical protein
MTPPNSRHRVHAELDELIAAQEEDRPALPPPDENAQYYANLDDDHNAPPTRTRSVIRVSP